MLGCVSLSWIAARCGRKCRSPSVLQMPRHQILQRSRDEEVFLPQPQLASGRSLVAGIEHLRDRFRARLLDQRADMVAAVEDVEPHRVGGARGPQPQRIDIAAAPSHDRGVVGDRFDGFVRQPDVARRAACLVQGLDPAAEVDVVDHLGPGELPWVAEGQPVLGIFLLPAVLDDLPEQSVVVADAVAVGRDAEARHALHEAGGEAAEAAVAKRGVGLCRAQPVGVDAEVAERGPCDVGNAEIARAHPTSSRPIRNSSER